MRIIYLKLVNYASIYTAMRRKKIEIDLSKSKNRIVLLIGDNGTGKTSIMSALQPFAYPGNVDIRNTEDLILPKVDGYKEIHILNDSILYIIKHHYIYNKTSGRTIKSFITKDDIELNQNGNVKSFLEIVLMELGLEIDYLKLLRLGSNVFNFIDMKATERKNFTSDLMSDIDIYSQFYKKVNEDTRILKTILRSVVEKINKLKILDENDLLTENVLLSNELASIKQEKDSINNLLWSRKGSIDTLIPEGVEVFINNLDNKEQLIKEVQSVLHINLNKIKKINVCIIGNVGTTMNDILYKININENTINTNANMIDFYFKQLDNYFNQKEEKENSLKYISSELEYSKLSTMYLELSKTKEKYDKLYKNYISKCTKDDMLTALRVMQEIDDCILNIHTFNHDAVTKVINHILHKENIDSIVKENVTSIDNKISNLNIKLMQLTSIGVNRDKVFILLQPPECKIENCSYINFYKNNNDASNDNSETKIRKELNTLETKREFFLSLNDIQRNIDYILLLIKSNSTLIRKMPEDFFNITNIMSSIKNCIPFYDENKITTYVRALEELEEYERIKSTIVDIKKELTFIEKNSTSLISVKQELKVLDINIYKLQEDIRLLKINNLKLTTRNDKLNEVLKELTTYNNLLNDINDKSKELNSIQQLLSIERNKELQINEFMIFKQKHEKKIILLEQKIVKLEDKISDNKFKLREFKSLNIERSILTEQFDELNIIREALSSNKGIPLLFIQLYLKNTKMIVNNLLEFIFKGELEIDDFEINDREFKIPYIKNGIRVSDIVFTSQGERSFVSLAISFALITQSIDKYNILLLDEIDSTLSQTNRPLFLNILEQQLDSIHSEQAFLITHNNMFDSYPVDLIITSSVELDNYRNMNIIFDNNMVNTRLEKSFLTLL